MNESKTELLLEFDRQVKNLIQKGYPKASNLSEQDFLNFVEPLKEKINVLAAPIKDLEEGHLPFVIVTKSELVPPEKSMELVERESKQGFIKLFPKEPKDFQIIENITIPNSKVYLLIDIDRGKETLNIRPSEALKTITKDGRYPLTIDEGIAIITHHPQFLKKNNCFSLLASRIPNNKQVPAIWINADKRPNLGWCWDGNPHTWLGSASAKDRVGT